MAHVSSPSPEPHIPQGGHETLVSEPKILPAPISPHLFHSWTEHRFVGKRPT